MSALFRLFAKDTRGVTALTFALALPGLSLAVGGGIDLSRAAAQRQQIANVVELGCQHAGLDIRFRKQQTNANPNEDYTSVVNQIVTTKLTERGLTGVTVSSTIMAEVITIRAGGTSTNVFGAVLGYPSVSVGVERKCNVAAVAAATGRVLFAESFEHEHNVASNAWTVLKNWNGWNTVNGGIEINGIPELAANTIRFGNFFAELDSHCYVSNCQTNSAMWREFPNLEPGNYELSYWYIARERNPAYAGKTLCAYKTDGQTEWNAVNGATWEGRTNRIEAFFQEKKSTGYAALTKDRNDHPELVDVCVHTDKWTERRIPLTVTRKATYRFYFQAAGRQDTYGGLLDFIRFCSGRCP
jgi:Flp pilus assembly protein TadG